MAGLTFEAIPMVLSFDAVPCVQHVAANPSRESARGRWTGVQRVLPEGARGLAIIPTRFPEPEQESQR